MNILYLLIPISVLLVFVIGLLFWWALNNRQFEALDDAAVRILHDTDTTADQPVNELADHAK
ncbi:MAG TPA: cbb3-type cytochrome oxidase assembly protein CcoS [Gallionellaceae bacterium]|nr:cbb3-type cytochrome oxidase assembly protein CcoS [Gallionellaceae bacterium]